MELESLEPDVLNEIILGSGTGGRRAAQQDCFVSLVRPLTLDDVPLLDNSPLIPGAVPEVKALKHKHHRLAQLMAQGVKDIEISFITGYSPAYLSTLRVGKDFQELLAYYAGQQEGLILDAQDRLKSLGIKAIEELDARLDEKPEGFTKGELLEVVDTAIVKPLKAQAKYRPGQDGGQVPGGVNVQVTFVSSKEQKTIEGHAVEVDL